MANPMTPDSRASAADRRKRGSLPIALDAPARLRAVFRDLWLRLVSPAGRDASRAGGGVPPVESAPLALITDVVQTVADASEVAALADAVARRIIAHPGLVRVALTLPTPVRPVTEARSAADRPIRRRYVFPIAGRSRQSGALVIQAAEELPAVEVERLLPAIATVVAQGVEVRQLRALVSTLQCGAFETLLRAIETKDRYTRGHVDRVAQYAGDLARAIGLSAQEVADVYLGGLLHDTGKIGIAESILGKPGPLEPAERQIMQRHPLLGYYLVEPIGVGDIVKDCIRHHHERIDGTGYPDRLAGEAIPIAARIMVIADSFDAMTSARPYRAPWSARQAVHEILRCAGAQFDEYLARKFARLVETGVIRVTPPAR